MPILYTSVDDRIPGSVCGFCFRWLVPLYNVPPSLRLTDIISYHNTENRALHIQHINDYFGWRGSCPHEFEFTNDTISEIIPEKWLMCTYISIRRVICPHLSKTKVYHHTVLSILPRLTTLHITRPTEQTKGCLFIVIISLSLSLSFWLSSFHCLPHLTHWGWVMHLCVSKLTIIGSDNDLSPGRRQAII